MTFKPTLPGLLSICFLFFASCKGPDKNSPATPAADAVDFSQLVSDWNKAHQSKDTGVLANLYDTSVLYYGIKKDSRSCIESKLSLFKKYPDYDQKISGEIQTEKINDMATKCSFTKQVTADRKTKAYPSYLVFSKKGNGWKIVSESDVITDKNLARKKEMTIPDDAISGDFNGDGVMEYAWLIPPKDSECQECSGVCTSYIKFSDIHIPPIKVESSIGGDPTNLGDLNKNGTDEIGLLPDWCTSCWRDYNVYTLKNDKWIYAVEPFPTHCNQWEDGVVPIEIDPKKEGHVLIRYSEISDTTFSVKTKSVVIK